MLQGIRMQKVIDGMPFGLSKYYLFLRVSKFYAIEIMIWLIKINAFAEFFVIFNFYFAEDLTV